MAHTVPPEIWAMVVEHLPTLGDVARFRAVCSTFDAIGAWGLRTVRVGYEAGDWRYAERIFCAKPASQHGLDATETRKPAADQVRSLHLVFDHGAPIPDGHMLTSWMNRVLPRLSNLCELHVVYPPCRYHHMHLDSGDRARALHRASEAFRVATRYLYSADSDPTSKTPTLRALHLKPLASELTAGGTGRLSNQTLPPLSATPLVSLDLTWWPGELMNDLIHHDSSPLAHVEALDLQFGHPRVPFHEVDGYWCNLANTILRHYRSSVWPCVWKGLRQLRIAGYPSVQIKGPDLLEFLERHRTTLERVELKCVTLSNKSAYNTSGYWSRQGTKTWTDLLPLLREVVERPGGSLQEVLIWGDLAWHAVTGEFSHVAGGRTCYLQEIETYKRWLVPAPRLSRRGGAQVLAWSDGGHSPGDAETDGPGGKALTEYLLHGGAVPWTDWPTDLVHLDNTLVEEVLKSDLDAFFQTHCPGSTRVVEAGCRRSVD
ncbi:hypothetical protein QBC39DRAFT_355736 [Podospora conica]|nr:hypothetical protein QBC39DRAFT_355736 [Schizothecium conicum]